MLEKHVCVKFAATYPGYRIQYLRRLLLMRSVSNDELVAHLPRRLTIRPLRGILNELGRVGDFALRWEGRT